jgi:hypothetical protein
MSIYYIATTDTAVPLPSVQASGVEVALCAGEAVSDGENQYGFPVIKPGFTSDVLGAASEGDAVDSDAAAKARLALELSEPFGAYNS